MRHTSAYDDEKEDEVRGRCRGRVGQSEKKSTFSSVDLTPENGNFLNPLSLGIFFCIPILHLLLDFLDGDRSMN